ncbi:hypothetical protein CNMCM7691_000524 [Aspergillus felis]|uniref:FAD-binding domain-containing protein n=1 Tax=Aspergillus felis TaxID=1287682 RepID=A0A8H6QW68_9EURO|nr:hypothetical protein CNMCM7691_000524 [Aspergillus felis]
MARPRQSPESTAPPGSSGITVIIVGLGIAGFTAAIECHRKGHKVLAFEKAGPASHIGDIIGIGSNGALVLDRWGQGAFAKDLNHLRSDIKCIEFLDGSGQLRSSTNMTGFGINEGYFMMRSDLVETMYNYAISLGISMQFNSRVTSYWEEEDRAGIIVNGERVEGDCVIASDGVYSKARAALKGDKYPLIDLGSVMRRSGGFPSKSLQTAEAAQWLFNGTDKQDRMFEIMHEETTFFFGTFKRGKGVYWACMHKTSEPIQHSWVKASDTKAVVELVKDWPIRSALEPIITSIPGGKCFEHLVMTMQPMNNWRSPQGRIMLIGDAAHPVLPTIGQGLSQGIMDGAVIAICLELAGKDEVRCGLQVMEMMRIKEASYLQDYGVALIRRLQSLQWEKLDQEEELVPRPSWIFAHDCQETAYKNFAKVMEALKRGEEYIPSHIPNDPSLPSTQEHDLAAQIKALRARNNLYDHFSSE